MNNKLLLLCFGAVIGLIANAMVVNYNHRALSELVHANRELDALYRQRIEMLEDSCVRGPEWLPYVRNAPEVRREDTLR